MFNRKPINLSKFGHLYPFDSHYADLNGLKYHYLDEGRGDPVVMIHGNPTWSFYYRALVRELCPHFRTIVPDHIGCGLSDKPEAVSYGYRLKNRVDDLEALFAHLKLKEKLTLIVHDWGGIIGMAAAVRRPEKISRIIVLNTAAFLPPAAKRLPLRLWAIRNIKPLAVPAVLGLNLFARGALYMAAHKPLAPDVKSGLAAPYNCWQNRIATLKFVQDIPVNEQDPSYHLVKYVDAHLGVLSGLPMLICWGERDFVFDTDYRDEWQRRFPKAEVHTFADAGHYVLEDAADKIIPLVKDFLQRHPR